MVMHLKGKLNRNDTSLKLTVFLSPATANKLQLQCR